MCVLETWSHKARESAVRGRGGRGGDVQSARGSGARAHRDRDHVLLKRPTTVNLKTGNAFQNNYSCSHIS